MPPELPIAVQMRLDAISADRVRGALDLAAEAAGILSAAAQAGASLEALQKAAGALEEGQPAMAPMGNLAELVRAQNEPDAVARRCRQFAEDLGQSARLIAAHASALIADGMTVMTHSSSRTVLETLFAAHGAGKRFRVLATESRPQCEGVALAAALNQAGIQATVIPDAAIARFMPEAGLVLVGADGITPEGLVNKTGTSLLALAARWHGKPVYALCGKAKFRNKASSALPADFESTPPALLTALVTEDGVLPAEDQRT